MRGAIGVASVVCTFALLAAPAQSRESKTDTTRLNCITPRAVKAVRADRQRIGAIDASCAREIRRKIPFVKTPTERHAVVSYLLAYHMAPYGPSNATSFSVLLRAPALDCDNYAFLGYFLHRAGWGAREASRDFIDGWDGAPITTHAEVHVGPILIDPTIGLVASGGYREQVAGKRMTLIVSLPYWDDLQAFRTAVIDALADGSFRSFQRLYHVKLGRLLQAAGYVHRA